MSNQEIFKKSGFLEENAIQNLSYEQAKLEIAAEIMRTEQAIRGKELEILKMKCYLSGLQYQDRTVTFSALKVRSLELTA